MWNISVLSARLNECLPCDMIIPTAEISSNILILIAMNVARIFTLSVINVIRSNKVLVVTHSTG